MSHNTESEIEAVCTELRDMLILEQLNVRIDDKLSRLAHGSADDEDAEWDLLGYLVLKRIAVERQNDKLLIDSQNT